MDSMADETTSGPSGVSSILWPRAMTSAGTPETGLVSIYRRRRYGRRKKISILYCIYPTPTRIVPSCQPDNHQNLPPTLFPLIIIDEFYKKIIHLNKFAHSHLLFIPSMPFIRSIYPIRYHIHPQPRYLDRDVTKYSIYLFPCCFNYCQLPFFPHSLYFPLYCIPLPSISLHYITLHYITCHRPYHPSWPASWQDSSPAYLQVLLLPFHLHPSSPSYSPMLPSYSEEAECQKRFFQSWTCTP